MGVVAGGVYAGCVPYVGGVAKVDGVPGVDGTVTTPGWTVVPGAGVYGEVPTLGAEVVGGGTVPSPNSDGN